MASPPYDGAMSPPSALVRALIAVSLLAILSGCARTRFYERKVLMQPDMSFNDERSEIYIRNKVEAAREGGFGGFGGAVAGGCACQ